MTQSPFLIAYLDALIFDDVQPFWVTAKVSVLAPIARGLGIWPETCTVRICKPERAVLPTDLSQVMTINLRIGLDNQFVTLQSWRIVDVREAAWGATTAGGLVEAVEWDLTLHDGRWRFTSDRGGVLFDGLLNALDPAGAIIGDPVTCSQLVTRCIQGIGGMTYREGLPLSAGLIASLDAFDPPTQVNWRGADAPTELQRLMEWTRHAVAFNLDGTYSIHKLVDPPSVPTPPDIATPPLAGGANVIQPEISGKCIITSAPTRNLIERIRTLTTPRPLQWVGVDVDGTVAPLEDLSWWPTGEDQLDVFKRGYADVDEEHRALAAGSIYRMLRLHDDDLAEGWTCVPRLLDGDAGDVQGAILLARSVIDDGKGMWAMPATKMPVKFQFDVQRRLIVSAAPLLGISGGRGPDLQVGAIDLAAGASYLSFTFCHLPNAGDDSDYFNAVYFISFMGDVLEDVSSTALEDAIAEGVPVYRFPDLQVQYREEAHPSIDVQPINLTQIKAIALQYATALLTLQNASVRVMEYPGIHPAEPNGSITRVVWDWRNVRTVVHLGTHVQITSDYLQRIIGSRLARGGGLGSPRGSSEVGVARVS